MNAIVFDLDGTLIDSAPDIRAAVNLMLDEQGHAPLDLPTITSFIGNGLPHLVKLTMTAKEIAMDRHAELTARLLDHYNASNGVLTTLYPGVEQVLRTLHQNGNLLGLCTNKPEQPARDILVHFGLLDLFSFVIGGDSLPERKPHPAPLAATFDGLGATGIYVGDSEVDAETAQRAGVPFALFTEGYRKRPVSDLPHDWTFGNFDSLPGIVETARMLGVK